MQNEAFIIMFSPEILQPIPSSEINMNLKAARLPVSLSNHNLSSLCLQERNSPGAAQRGHCIDLWLLFNCCVFVWGHRQCVWMCVHIHTHSCILPRAHIYGHARFLFHSRLHHVGEHFSTYPTDGPFKLKWTSITLIGGAENKARRSLQTAGVAGGSLLLSSGLLSLNPVATLSSSSVNQQATLSLCSTEPRQNPVCCKRVIRLISVIASGHLGNDMFCKALTLIWT